MPYLWSVQHAYGCKIPSELVRKIASRLWPIKTPGAVFTLAGRRHVGCTTKDCWICWCRWVSISAVYPAFIQLYNWRMALSVFRLLIVGMQLAFWAVFLVATACKCHVHMQMSRGYRRSCAVQQYVHTWRAYTAMILKIHTLRIYMHYTKMSWDMQCCYSSWY